MSPPPAALLVRALAMILIVALASPVAAQGSLKKHQISILGNRVIIDEVYKAILVLPPGASANLETAKEVKAQLLDFLHKSGFELATVKVTTKGNKLVVEVNEGNVEKILFFGRGALTTLELKLTLQMPHHVFNRPSLERQLNQLKAKYGISSLTYDLVPTKTSEAMVIPEGEGGTLFGYTMIPPSAYYDLHIYIGKGKWGSGFGFNLDYDKTDGLILGMQYKQESLLFPLDRAKVSLIGGFRFSETLDDGLSYTAISRIKASAWYATPSMSQGDLRITLGSVADLVAKQRPDLLVESYYLARFAGTLSLSWAILDELKLVVGGGMEGLELFWVDQLPSPPLLVSDGFMSRPFAAMTLTAHFGYEGFRKDHGHVLKLQVKHYWNEAEGGYEPFGRVGLWYRKVLHLDWHEFWFRVKGEHLWGGVRFYDEIPVGGRYLRGIFGSSYYVFETAGLSVDFRVSLVRDLFKIGFFHDLAVFAVVDRGEGTKTLRIADAMGMGFYALVLDTFQFAFSYSAGFSSDGSFDHGLLVSVEKVF